MQTISEPSPMRIVDISGSVQTLAAHNDGDLFPPIEWEAATGTEGSTFHIAERSA